VERILEVKERLAEAATLPSWVYVDPEIVEREARRVFGATWQLVGRLEQVAEPGRFFTAAVAGEPIVVVRGADFVLRALSNVCRHRAGPVSSGEGSVGSFRCGYHGWTYALDGRLRGTPEFEGVEGFDRGSCRLPEFRVETWLGLVFVNLTTDAPPLRQELSELAPFLESKGLDRMRLAGRRDWTLDCNWKVYVDNYLEGYHIPIVHPGLMQELDYAAYRTETFRLHSLQEAPIKESPEKRLRKAEGDAEARYYWVYPNLMLNVYPDNFSTNVILPLGPERTLTVFEWFFREPASPEVAPTLAFSDEIQHEDIAICEAVQRGLRSRTYDRGRFSVKRENGVHHFHRLYAERMSAPGEGDPA